MRDKTVRVFLGSSLGLIYALCVACAGGATPAHDQELEDEIAAAYGDGAPVSAAGSASMGAGGSGGSVPASGVGGSASSGTAGAASSAGASNGTGAAGSASVAGAAGGGGSAAGACDGFAVLSGHCGGSSCHGAASPGTLSNFASSEDAAKGFVGKQSAMCAATDNAVLLDSDKPAASLIIKKAAGTSGCGSRMPLGLAPLSDADMSCLQDWIGGL